MSASSGIRTPDQRLRVFVSSTLRELAAERAAVRAAVERLAMAPVMFELGARPHPPRDLYRAYLAQSDIFVGIYGDSYGWVAPGEQVSGLEDEYLLAPPDLPKLIYIRTPQQRQERLTDLLGRIRDDDRAAYKAFATAEELGELVTADLATLLAERFDGSGPAVERDEGAPAVPTMTGVPAPLTRLIGRDREVDELVRLLAHDGARLVTVTGPGGIGKTRLATAAVERLVAQGAFPGGVAFVDLAPVRDPAQVTGAVAQALGVRDTGDVALGTKIVTALRDRRALLVLDNAEQVIDTAPALRDLLLAAPSVSALVTSRMLLRIGGERTVPLDPLPLAIGPERTQVETALTVPSVALFVERARAVRPDFDLRESNVDAVVGICDALDGVPLAIELAAARIRFLPPQALLDRLGRSLPVLVGGPRDLPDRQRTLRSAIEWSTRLLAPAQQRLLARLGVFAGTFSLDAAEWIADGIDADPMDALAALVDGSLVRQEDRGERAVFSMLATVREYALEQLAAGGGLDAARDRHARYFVRLAARAELELEGSAQGAWIARLTDDRQNVRAAVRFLLDERRWSEAAELAWDLYVYWWVGGQLGPICALMREPLDSGDELDTRTRAITMYFTLAISFWHDPGERLVQDLRECAALFAEIDDASGEALALVSLALALLTDRVPDPAGADAVLRRSQQRFHDAGDSWGEAFTLVTLGRVDLLSGRVNEALLRFDQSFEVAHRQQDGLGQSIALNHRGWVELLLGRPDAAASSFGQSLSASVRLGHDEGVAYGLEGVMAVSAARGDLDRAGRLLGAAEVVREQKGVYNAAEFAFHQPAVDAILAGPGAGAFTAARSAGRRLDTASALRLALEDGSTGRQRSLAAATAGDD